MGSRGNKIFLKKWGMTINFFEKNFLKSGLNNNKELIFTKFSGPLKEPKKNIYFIFEYIKCYMLKIYLLIINFK